MRPSGVPAIIAFSKSLPMMPALCVPSVSTPPGGFEVKLLIFKEIEFLHDQRGQHVRCPLDCVGLLHRRYDMTRLAPRWQDRDCFHFEQIS